MKQKSRVFRITRSGHIEGLYTDGLADVAGDLVVERASRVEFCTHAGGWIVELLIGPYRGAFLPKVFKKRQDALTAEVAELNRQLACGLL